MAFDNDVFISYAHLDNQALSAGSEGWVSEFAEALGKRLGEVLGKSPRIWRDPKLQGNDVFGDELVARYQHAAALVSVLTPRYVESEWCQRELTGFWQAADCSGGPVLGTKARVFKVVKTPVEPDRIPAPVKPLLGYEFYRLQPGNGRPLEFNKVYGADAERDFWVRLNDLAYDLADVLKLLEQAGSAAAVDQPAAYLAMATADLRPQHEALRRELLRHGWRVLPDVELPLIEAEVEHLVTEQLADCVLSVHLVGAAYGVVPEGGVESVPVLQARLAAVRAGSAGLARLVWIAPGSAATDARQQGWIAALRNDPAPGPGSDLLETPFEELKGLIVQRMQAAETPAPTPPQKAPGARPARVYLVCSAADVDAVRPLQLHLHGLGVEVVLPLFEGDETQLRELHEGESRDCDGLLVYYGAGGELWLRQKLAELRRLPALGRSMPLRASAICIAPPATAAKQQLLTHEAPTLAMTEGFTPAALQPFTTALLGPG